MTDAEERLIALGYEKLAALSPEAAARALAAAQTMAARLPQTLDPAREPATVYLAGNGKDGGAGDD